VTALAELTPLALLVLALGLAIVTLALVRAAVAVVRAVVGKVPYLGDALAAAVDRIGQSIIHALGRAVSGIESAIGWTWHNLAKEVSWIGREIRSHAQLLGIVSPLLADLVYLLTHLRTRVKSVEHSAHAHDSVLERLKRHLHGIDRKLKHLEREIEQGIGDDVLPRLKALDKEVGRIETREIPKLRSDVATAEGDLTALGQWVKDHALVAGTGALTGAVAWALGRLGLDWLRCRSNPFNGNKNACGLWGDLAGLLGLVTAVLAVSDFEDLIREMQALEGAVIGAAEDLFGLD